MTKPFAYYNEHDPAAAAWLRELIRGNHICPGEVDERSIVEVQPSDLVGFVQCHFFAGIGVWSAALRALGWPDDRPVWSGSCPCPPFSSAGKKKPCPECGRTRPVPHVGRTGYFVCLDCNGEWLADGRHLWPELWRLVAVGRPPVLFGEQVASEDGRIWLASVRASLEILGYAVGAADTCAAGVGAPHIRQRLYFGARRLGVAAGLRGTQVIEGARLVGEQRSAIGRGPVVGPESGATGGGGGRDDSAGTGGRESGDVGAARVRGDMGDADSPGRGVEQPTRIAGRGGHADGSVVVGGMGDAGGARREGDGLQPLHGGGDRRGADERAPGSGATSGAAENGMADSDGDGRDQTGRGQSTAGDDGSIGDGRPRELVDAEREGLQGFAGHGGDGDESGRLGTDAPRSATETGATSGMADASNSGAARLREISGERSDQPEATGSGTSGRVAGGGFWDNALWVPCRDGKARPVEPGTFPLAHGAVARVVRLRGYGNAIVKQQAEAFVEAFEESAADLAGIAG